MHTGLFTQRLNRQDRTWIDREDQVHKISEMEDGHLANLIYYARSEISYIRRDTNLYNMENNLPTDTDLKDEEFLKKHLDSIYEEIEKRGLELKPEADEYSKLLSRRDFMTRLIAWWNK